MGYSYVDLDDIEPAGPGGAVRFVRRELGATAVGCVTVGSPREEPYIARGPF